MMMNSQNPEVLARAFWAGTGLEQAFPRELEQVIPLRLPLALIKLSVLTLPAIEAWLAGRQLAVSLPLYRHDLLGCLVAYRGRGFVFMCSSDSADERRLTLAHEAAHFLVDYMRPRQQVFQALGDQIADVLDGMRKATPAERAAAILSRVRLGAHIHLLPRPGADQDADFLVACTEARADRLALELVAPQEQIRSFLRTLPARDGLPSHEVRAALAAHFGLPAYAFASVVRPKHEPRPLSFLEDVRAALRR